ncbi:hypothetical protein Ancab_018823 [Ancistrocladus abbreviatus]
MSKYIASSFIRFILSKPFIAAHLLVSVLLLKNKPDLCRFMVRLLVVEVQKSNSTFNHNPISNSNREWIRFRDEAKSPLTAMSATASFCDGWPKVMIIGDSDVVLDSVNSTTEASRMITHLVHRVTPKGGFCDGEDILVV